MNPRSEMQEMGFEPGQEKYFYLIEAKVMEVMSEQLGISHSDFVERYAASISDVIHNDPDINEGIRTNAPDVVEKIVARLKGIDDAREHAA